MNKLPESNAIVRRGNTRNILAQKRSFEQIFNILPSLKRGQNVNYRKDIHLALSSTEYSSIDSLENVARLVMLDWTLVFYEDNHERVVVYVVFLEEFAISCDLFFEHLSKRRLKLNLLLIIYPVLIFKLISISFWPTI